MREARGEKARIESEIAEMEKEIRGLRSEQEVQEVKHEELGLHVRHLRE